jgi:hypothetical protein
MSSVVINRFNAAFLNEILNFKPTILISRIQEIWLAQPEGVRWNIRNPVHESTMVRWWKQDGTNVKQRLNDGETTMVWWLNKEGMMMKMWWDDDETAMAWWWNRDINFTIVSSHHRDFTIVPSLFHHRAVVFSSSYYRYIALSPLNFRV